MKIIKINDHKIGFGQPCFFIAEAGVNHNGNVEMAFQLIDAAVSAGADAVKFQTFKAEKIISPAAPKAKYQQNMTGRNETQLEMVKSLELSYDKFQMLFDYCTQKGILFLSTPFEEESADFLDSLGVSAFKVPSGEITNLPFLKHLARKGKPLVVSTGMASLGEVESAVQEIKMASNREIVLLHCVSDYPADPADANLRVMQTMEMAFGVPVGFSDHTMGVEVAYAAVALGACVIEKHFSLDRTLPGPDHRASLEPHELKILVKGIRTVEASLGHGRKEPTASEADTIRASRKSIVAAQDIPAGSKLTEDLLAVMRPGTGLPPSLLPLLTGRTVRETVQAGTVITLEMLR